MELLLLGVDVGTSSTKAVLVDREGLVVASSTVPTPFVADGERVEMTVDALHRCLGEVLAGLGERRARVAALGLAGMAESGAPLDAARQPLAPVLAWHDSRGQEVVDRLLEAFGPDLALRIGQPVRTVLTVAKLGWLLRSGADGPHGVHRMERWLGVPELGLRALTGSEAIEFSQAARTGCYDVTAREWIPEVATTLDFSVDVFAPVRPAGSVMGRVSASGAVWSGLPEDVPVTVAGHDHLAGMAGAGVPRGRLANSVGTAETIVARADNCPDMARAASKGVAVTVYPGGREWAALVSVVRAGMVLRTAAKAFDRSYEELDALAEAASSAEVGQDAVDGLMGGDPSLLPEGPPGEVWAGLLDALTTRAVEAWGRLAEVVGPPQGMVVFGGGSESDRWLAAKAARFPFPIERTAGTSAVARGAAVHAGVAAGWWPSADAAPSPVPQGPPAGPPPPVRR